MSQEIGWSVEAKLLYQIKQLTRALNSRTYIAVFPNFASFPNPGITGTLYVDESTGDIYVWNGTSYVLLSSGITALNGLIAAAQTFATGTVGTDFNISSAGTTHTFNFPTASAVNRGLLSSADWTTFNSKIGGTGTTNYVPKFTASGTIGNSQIFDNGTNVGIGTTTPTAPLTIHNPTLNTTALEVRGGGGSSQSRITMTYGNATASTQNALLFSNTSAVGLEASLNRFIYFSTGTSSVTERMRITAAGRLLVGTSTEGTNTVDIAGTLRSTQGANFATASGNVGIGTSSPINSTNYTTVTIGGGSTNRGQLTFNSSTTAVGYLYNDATNMNIGSDSALIFQTSPAANERMRITSAGNVGIGTTTPSERLDVRTTTVRNPSNGEAHAAFYTQAAQTINRGAQISLGGGIDNAGTTVTNFAIVAGLKEDSTENNTAGTLSFWTRANLGAMTRRMTVTSTGNVLIGTTTDGGQLLQVAGSSLFSGSMSVSVSGAGSSGIVITPTSATYTNSAIFVNTTRANNSAFKLLDIRCSSIDTFIVRGDGNVNMGTSGWGTNATFTLAISTGVAPTTSPADAFQLYSADVVAGNAAPHFRTENGAVVKVYQETTGVGAATFVQGSVNAVYEDSTFDGYTLKQIVKALRNQGLLA